MSRFSFSLRDAALPTVAVEVAGHRVSAAKVDIRGGRPVVVAHGEEPLAEGALVPSLTAPNIRDRAGILSALGRVLARVGTPKRIGLIVPDPIAKVSLLKFQHVPPREQDLEQLIRWQVRKALPFPIEEAQVSYVPAERTAEGTEFIVSLARREIVAEYESLCASAGAYAGIVDLSTFGAINAVVAGSLDIASDWLLVNVTPEWASIAIMRGANLIFFRNRSADGEGTLADLVHQTAMYYEDRLSGSGFGRVMLCGASSVGAQQAADVEALRKSLEERLARPVEQIDSRTAAALTDRISASPTLLDALAPLVGLLARDQEAVA